MHMIVLRDTASMRNALEHTLPAPLAELIAARLATFGEYVEVDLSEVAHFLIIEPGDTLAMVIAELGFSPLTNLVDGSRYGDPAFTPSFEWLQDHGGVFELVYILSDDGFGKIIFVPDDPGIDFDLHMLCLEFADRS
jgi:hypothetical protein